MRSQIDGADRQSGKDISLELEAKDQAQAEQLAMLRGVLVSTAKPITPAATADYATPSAAAQDVPAYDQIRRGASWLRVLGAFASAAGWLTLIFVAIGILALIDKAPGISPSDVATVVVVGVILLAIGAGLRMLAALALAHRDLVRHVLSRR